MKRENLLGLFCTRFQLHEYLNIIVRSLPVPTGTRGRVPAGKLYQCSSLARTKKSYVAPMCKEAAFLVPTIYL